MKNRSLTPRNVLRHLAPLSLALLAVLAGLAPGTARAGVIDPAYESYLNTLPAGQKVSVLIYLADQAPISQMDADLHADEATLPVRHETVITALMDKAAATQPALLADLEARKTAGQVVGYTPYWIANLVVAQMTVAAVREVAARPEVGVVYSNFTASLVEPVGGVPDAEGTPGERGIGVTPGLRAINAPRAWYELGITGAGRIVCGLDTGVMGTHPALQARWRGAGGAVPWQQCWLDRLGTNTQFPSDTAGHGTHTMGTMTGLGAATQDTIGVAWGARWIACNAINQGVGAEFDNDVIAAFQWIADPDGNPGTPQDVPDVVQNSWRINEGFPGGYTDCDPRWWAVMDGCEAAGVAVVFSAGNEGPGAMTIGSPPDRITTPTNAFAIGAVDATNFGFPYPIASFSSRGPSGCNGVTIKPEVSAPGVTVYSSTNNGGYAQVNWSGTSMAGPHVSGICALMRQANPNIDVTTMKQIIMNTARDEGAAGEDNSYGWGVVDAYAAVREALCTAHSPLASGVSVATPAPAGYYRFNQPTIYWSAAAVRSTADWDIRVYQNASGGSGNVCFSGLLASSAGVGITDFVIGDFNHNALGTYYVYDFQYPDLFSAVDGRTEWDDGADALVVNGPLVSRSTGATDLIEVWDVFLTAGTPYTFEFTRFGADTKLMLFRNPASATYWTGRFGRVFETTTTTTYTAPADDWYGVVVVNDDGAAGQYTVRVGTCTAPTALASGASVFTPASVGYYSFAQPTIYWSAAGVRATTDWDIQVFQTGSGGSWPACFSGQLAASTGVGIADFVIGDFNHNALGTYYVWPYAFTGVGDATTEWDDGSDQIPVGGALIDRDTGASDVLEVWDVFLNGSTDYDIYFERTGAADTKLLLFRSLNGTYWAGRSGATLTTANLHTFYTAPASDWYGIVVVNDNGSAGHYRLGISPASAAAGDRGPRGVPALTALRQAAPNPTSGDVQIGFDLRDQGEVGLEILDVTGRVVAMLPSRAWEAGTWQARWDSRGQDGRRMPAGVYWVRMSIGSQEVGRNKFMLLR